MSVRCGEEEVCKTTHCYAKKEKKKKKDDQKKSDGICFYVKRIQTYQTPAFSLQINAWINGVHIKVFTSDPC